MGNKSFKDTRTYAHTTLTMSNTLILHSYIFINFIFQSFVLHQRRHKNKHNNKNGIKKLKNCKNQQIFLLLQKVSLYHPAKNLIFISFTNQIYFILYEFRFLYAIVLEDPCPNNSLKKYNNKIKQLYFLVSSLLHSPRSTS